MTRSLISGNVLIGATVIGLLGVQRAHARHAHQPRLAVHLRAAGAALAGLAVPAHGQVDGLRRLHRVDDVEHDLPLVHRRRCSPRTRRPLASPRKTRIVTGCISFASSKYFASSAGICGSGVFSISIAPSGFWRIALFHLPHSGSVFGKSSRVWPPRLSVRWSAAHGDRLGDGEQRAQVHRQVPAGVVLLLPSTPVCFARSLYSCELGQRLLQLGLGADDADQVVHRLLQLALDRVRVLGALALEVAEHVGGDRVGLGLVDLRLRGDALRVLGSAQARAPPEDEQVGERVAAQAVRAVHAARALARGEQAGHGGSAGVGVDAHAAHHVVRRRADFHRDGRDVDVGQRLELVVHARQRLADVLGRPARGDVQEDAAVLGAAAGLHLGVDRAGHLVARQQVGRAAVLGLVAEPLVGLFLGVGGLGAEVVR